MGSLTRESFLRVRIRAKQSAMDIAVIRCRSQTVRGSKKEATDRGDLFSAYFQRKSRSSPACWNSEEGQRSLVGARPLHLACARPFGRLKAPLGLSLLRCAAQTRACRVAGGTGSSCKQRKTGSSHLLGIRKTVFEK